jgi:hypothetical protein
VLADDAVDQLGFPVAPACAFALVPVRDRGRDLARARHPELVDIHAGPRAGGLDLASQAVTMWLADLREEGLLEDAEGGPTLTPKGEVVASRYLDEVNE